MLTSSIALFCAVLLPLDSGKPKVTVNNLTNQKRFTDPVFTVRGRADDGVGVSAVWYQLNGAGWSKANGTTVWAAPVTFAAGPNQFQVYAEDAAVNHSPTSNVSCFLSVPGQLTLVTNGLGKIVPIGFKGNSLEIGRVYTVKAISTSDTLFSGWNGESDPSKNPLTFVMQSNLVLTAGFIPNPFPALQGDYNGLFYPSDDASDLTLATSATNSGSFTLKITSSGAFSGKLVLDGTARALSGRFDANLSANVGIKMQNGLQLSVSLQFDDSTGVLGGSVQSSEDWSSTLVAYRASIDKQSLYAGTYTLLVEGCDKNGQCFQYAKVPYGDGPGAIKVTPSGAIQLTGTLSDGTAISHHMNVSENGWWPLYVAPYRGRGLLIGWLNLSSDSGGLSSVMWEKPAKVPGEKYYTEGFSSFRVARVAACSKPSSNEPAFPTSCVVKVNSGNLPSPLLSTVALTNNPPVVLGGEIKDLTLNLTYENGQFKGSFIHPVTKRPTVVRGAINSDAPTNAPYYGNGGGWFLGPSGESGNIRVLPE